MTTLNGNEPKPNGSIKRMAQNERISNASSLRFGSVYDLYCS